MLRTARQVTHAVRILIRMLIDLPGRLCEAPDSDAALARQRMMRERLAAARKNQ